MSALLALVLLRRGTEQLLDSVDPFGEPRPVAGESALRATVQGPRSRRRWLLCWACHRHRHFHVAAQRNLLRLLTLLLLALFRCERGGGRVAAALAIEIGDVFLVDLLLL